MERLQALAERWPWLQLPLDVQVRVAETRGSAIASAASVMFFLALFPLILVAIAVVGFVASGSENVAGDIVDGLGLTGRSADLVTDAVANAESSRRAASIVGLAGLLWSGLRVATAVALAVRAPWQRKVKAVRSRLRGLVWLAGGAVTFGGAVAMGALLNRTPDVVPRPVTTAALVLGGLALEVGFFLWTFWILGDRLVGWRALVPGAVFGALGFEVLKVLATVVVPRLVASSSALYGPIGAVFALITWLMLFSRLIVYASALNAVRWEAVHGTVTLRIPVPHVPGEYPVETDRGGAVDPEPEPDADDQTDHGGHTSGTSYEPAR